MDKISVFHSTAKLYSATADKILAVYNDSIKKHGKFTIALSGGNTPKKVYELMAESSYAGKVNWNLFFIFWSDERCVPVFDEENNSHMASVAWLDNVPIPQENIFRVPVNFGAAKAAVKYEEMIRRFFGSQTPHFNLVLLGLGDDGHTASLFPGSPVLTENVALVKDLYVKEKDSFRVTFTVTLINLSENVLFIVSGKEKAEIVEKVLGSHTKKIKYPARLVKPVKGNLYWFLDKAAASLLKS